jgi:hypothetical protein
MYSKDEAARIRQSFWTTFGQYIAPQLSADGLKINWINYKTGLKHVYFRMNAANRSADIAIVINHPDTGVQELFYEQFFELKQILHAEMGEEWTWSMHEYDENGRIISRIYKEIRDISIFNRNDWPVLISFFKPRIIALDEFWSVAKYSFDALK